jgi:hypothetical protein
MAQTRGKGLGEGTTEFFDPWFKHSDKENHGWARMGADGRGWLARTKETSCLRVAMPSWFDFPRIM